MQALDAGADDYVVKPFGSEELMARIRAALRRAAPAESQPSFISNDLNVDFETLRFGERPARAVDAQRI